MALGVLSMFVSVWAVTLGKHRKGFYRIHRIAGVAGFALFGIGLVIAVGMVQASGGPHLRVPHGVLGAATLALALLGEGGGILTRTVRSRRKRFLPIHTWAGRAIAVILLLTILAGLRQVGIL